METTLAVEVALNYSMAPPKDAVDQTIARPPIVDGNPYSTPAPWFFCLDKKKQKKQKESFSYLGWLPAFGFFIVCST